MEIKPGLTPNYVAPRPLPFAPPMYPTLDQSQPQPQQQLPPVVFHSGPPPTAPETRPTSVFILNGKPPMGPEPVKAVCPHCQQPMTSKVVAKISLKTHFAALLCCVLGLFCFAPIPYCMNAFKNLHHYCNNCGQYLGLYTAK